uniref:SnoaL-like domain-containing protein n=1 Tax=Mycena chlorophos TaxID=658473 RepID=A0ABQ0L3P9_MYCCL|nr:predicted protein [Mycena chlorophos]
MPKPVVFTPKPALAKLPLAARKDLRDNFEAKQDDLKTQIKNLVGVDLTFDINTAEVWAYAPEDKINAGSTFTGYIEGFIRGLENFVKTYGDMGKEHFAEAVSAKVLTIVVNPLGDKGETISTDVHEGVYRILFRHDRLGYNMSQQWDLVLPAIDSVPRPQGGMSLTARYAIENDYVGSAEPVIEQINKMLGAEFTFDPNFEANYAALKAAEDAPGNWERNFGNSALNYWRGFKNDEMLQEGLQEIVETKTFRIRVNPKTKATIETVIEDGVVYVQARPERFAYNHMEAGTGLVKLL